MIMNFRFNEKNIDTECLEDDYCAAKVHYDYAKNTAALVSRDDEESGWIDMDDLCFMKSRPFRQVDAYSKLDRNTQAWIRNRKRHLYTADGLEPYFYADEIRDEDIRTIYSFVSECMSSLRSSFIAFLLDEAALISEKKCNEIIKELLTLDCFPQAWQKPMADVRSLVDVSEDCFVTQSLPASLAREVSEEEMCLLSKFAVLYLNEQEREKVYLDALEKTSYGQAVRFYDNFVREGLLPPETGEALVLHDIADAFDEIDEVKEGLYFLKQKGFTDDELRYINPFRLRFLNIHNVERIWRMMSEALGKTDEELKEFFVHSGWYFEDPIYSKEPFEILKANGITDETISSLLADDDISLISAMNPETLRKVMERLCVLEPDEEERNQYILDNLEFLSALPEAAIPQLAAETDDYFFFWKAEQSEKGE